jgi:outer membrane protein OmpA-like peptidoglycan-associated protein
MKKWLLLLLLFVFAFIHLQAQVRLGVFGGAQATSVLETNHLPGWDSTTKPFERGRTGFQLGAMLEMPIGQSGLFFQPSFSFITKGRIYDKNNDSLNALATDTIYNKSTLKLTYVEFPLNLTYKIPITRNHNNKIFVSAGPYVSFIYSGNVTTENLTGLPNSKYSSATAPVTVGKGADTYKTWDIGVDARAGFELGRVVLSAYFSHGFTNFYNATYPGTFHNQVVGATLGFWLTSAGSVPRKTRDTDHDGINDEEDDCPLQPGAAEFHGCPAPDHDHDGVDDQHDSCPTVPGFARYHGCPIPDTDHDGIDDEHDSCPAVAGLARYHGCPIPDRDHDGVNDEEDQCPDSAGPVTNRGCPLPAPAPEIKKETTDHINYIAHNILFKPGSDLLTDGSFTALEELVPLLKAHPNWRLTIEGYTDNSGTMEGNIQLSSKRAGAVKAYLMSKGVDERQLNSVGYGQEHPIADNRTAAGKRANRRVELKLH